MKNIFKLIAILTIAFTMAACDRVPAGSVGVKVYLLGGDKGVDTEELGVGRYWIGINEELHLFPTFTQNYVWTESETEGSPDDESINFQTIEGMKVSADVGISYAIDPTKVSMIFEKYRRGIEEITDIYLRNMVRDAFVTIVSKKQVVDVYGAGKSDIVAEVQEHVRAQVSQLGINVEKIYLINQLRLPPEVTNALNAKIRATQEAQQRENEVQKAIAQAEIDRQQAQGEADAVLIRAQAEADAIRIKTEAMRNNAAIIQLNAVEKWNGVMPTYVGGETPMPFLSVK